MIAATTSTPNSDAAASRSLGALTLAVSVGACALLYPPLAVLALAALAARALMSGAGVRLDAALFVGPLALAIAIGALFGLAPGVGVFFACRLFIDARWSVREATRLAQLSGRPKETGFAALAHAWLTPAYGLALVAYTAPHMIAGLPLDLPHVPFLLPLVAAGLAAGATFDWGLRRMADWRLGELATAPAAHLLSHHILFLTAFGLTLDVSAGIAALIAWRLAHAAPVRQANFTAVP